MLDGPNGITKRRNKTYLTFHTPGYVRQAVNLGSVGASNGHTPGQRIGSGVQTLGVDPITDEVKTKQFNDPIVTVPHYAYINLLYHE